MLAYLSQFLIILAFTLGGEALQRLLPFPVPASVYGLLLVGAVSSLSLVSAGLLTAAIYPLLVRFL